MTAMTDAEIGQALKRAHGEGWRPTGYHTHSREMRPGVKECIATSLLAQRYANETITVAETSFAPGDEVIRRREPKGRHEDAPLVGTVIQVYGEDVRVRWHGAVRYGTGSRGDNHTMLKASALLPATTENVRHAEEQLKGRRSAHFAMRAERYEEQAREAEEQGNHEGAEWCRREAALFWRAAGAKGGAR